jgi:Tol biopolymer transport system component
VRHCLEKNPEERFHSARDLAFALEALTEISATSKSGGQQAIRESSNASTRRSLVIPTVAVAFIAMAALGWWLGKRSAIAPTPEYQQITFRTGNIGNARFTPDGSIVYDASWEGGDRQIYTARTDDTGSRELGIQNAELLSISKNGELAIRLNTVFFSGYARSGTLARVPLSGGTPREVLDNVQDAEWAADGENMAVVRYVPANNHWHLEYPVGHVLLDSINWIGEPRISPDGKRVAFADHENPGGDDEGSIAVIASDGNGQEKKLSTGWSSIEGIVWSPGGNEIWFTASDSGSADNLRGVTVAGKLRNIVNVPGGMWLEDIRNGVALTVTQRHTQGIRGIQPGGKEEHELGWLGWSYFRDISRDGKKVLFEEQADGGGPNYTVFLRDTDGSPPVRIGEGEGRAISPDNKWVITKPNKGGPLSVVPTGAGEARQLTHDDIRYNSIHYLDEKHLLASGIEAGHGRRNYLIDLSNGNAKPITPEGIAGTNLSPDGRSVVVVGPDGNFGIWPMDGSGLRPIPGFDSKYVVTGWTPDGASLYAFSSQQHRGPAKIFRVDPVTGKMEFWKTFGADSAAAGVSTGAPRFSSDGSAYVYTYIQVLSEAYVVKGLK